MKTQLLVYCFFMVLTSNNRIHIWLAFPNLNNFGVSHLEEVENWNKIGRSEHTSIGPILEKLCKNFFFVFI